MPLLCISFPTIHKESVLILLLRLLDSKKAWLLFFSLPYLIGLLRVCFPSSVRMLAVRGRLHVCVSVSRRQAPASPTRTVGDRLTVPLPGATVARPDPAPSIDGSKFAMNPSVLSAVPKACQLAETKPFVGRLNPTDGEMDSK